MSLHLKGIPSQTTLRFSSVSKLIELEKEKDILGAFTTSTCLLTIAKINDIRDMDLLIDFIDIVKIQTKHLVILTSRMLPAGLKQRLNKPINFDVRFQIEYTGNNMSVRLFDSAVHNVSTKKVQPLHLCVLKLEKMQPYFKLVHALWMIRNYRGKALISLTWDFHPSLSTLSLLVDQTFKQ